MTEDAVDALRMAIVKQACLDYYDVCAAKRPRISKAARETHSGQREKERRLKKRELVRFFRSDYFLALCNIDAQVLIREIEHRQRQRVRLFKRKEEGWFRLK